MKLFKNKHFYVSALFIFIITVVFIGTAFTSGKYIAWNLVKNNKDYRDNNSINSKLNSYVSAYESAFNESVFMKEKYIDIFGLIQNAMGKRVIPTDGFTGTIVKGDDNKLYTANSVTIDSNNNDDSNNDINEYANSLVKFSSILKNRGSKLLYVQAPQRYSSEVEVPIFIDAKHDEKRINKMLSSIEGKVDYINFNKIIEENNINRDTVFFKTDHHWTVESAFLCFQNICKYVNQDVFNIDSNLYNIDNWSFNVLKNSYLGSSGVRVGSYYVGKDDFALIAPNFKTSFVREYTSSEKTTHSGDFKHAIISNYDTLIKSKNPNPIWGDYCGSDTSFVSIKNLMPENNKKVLVVKDSFALPVCAFLSTVCEKLDICDLRLYDKSLIDTVDNGNYDLVIIIYNPGALSKTFFDFN